MPGRPAARLGQRRMTGERAAPRQAHAGVAGTGSSPWRIGAVVAALAGLHDLLDAASEDVLRAVGGQNAAVRAKAATAA